MIFLSVKNMIIYEHCHVLCCKPSGDNQL